MRTRTIAACGILLLSAGAQVHAQVQWSAPSANDAQLATITTDTGAFAPGHRDFSRYEVPDLCRMATKQTRGVLDGKLENQRELDALRDSSQDTVIVRAVANVAHACGSRFSLDRLKVAHDLEDLFEVAVQAGSDSLAQSALDRIMAQTQQSKKDSVLLHEFQFAVGYEPPRSGKEASQSIVRSLLTQIDREGSWSTRLATHNQLLNTMSGGKVQATEQFISWLRQAPADADKVELGKAAYYAYKRLMSVAFFERPDSMPAIAQRAKQEKWEYYLNNANKPVQIQKMTEHEIFDSLSPLGAGWYVSQREKVPRLQADFWFPKGTNTVQPVPGKVTLLVNGIGAEHAAKVRRWLAQYGARGLVVTYIVSIRDTANVDGDFDAMYGPFTASQWAERMGRFVLNYENLPVTVAVQVNHHFKFVPAPDGRMVQTDTVNDSELCTLVGRDGAIIHTGGTEAGGDNVDWDVLLAWAVAQPTPTDSTSGSASQSKPIKP